MTIKDFQAFDLKTYDTNINDFFVDTNTKIFYIPPFQRFYTWKVEQCEVFIDDIKRSLRNEMKHFLGDVTVYKNGIDKIGITDGQQRLTTIMLLALAAVKVIKTKGKKYNDDVERFKTIAYSYRNSSRETFKVSLNRDDLTVLEKLVKDDPTAIEKVDKTVRKESNIEKNYNRFVKFIEEYINENKDLEDLYNAIRAMQITVMNCNMENSQIIYENKNSKGLPLAPIDLVKNLLFSKIPEDKQFDYFEKYWLEIERNVYRNNMESFFMDTMIAVSQKKGVKEIDWTIAKRMLQNTVDFLRKEEKEEKIEPEEQAKRLLNILLKYSKLYNEYMNIETGYIMTKENPLKNRFYEYETIFNGNKYNAVMLYLLNEMKERNIKESVLVKTMDAFVVAQCRAKYIGQYKGAQRQNAPALITKIKEVIKDKKAGKLDEEVWKILLTYKNTTCIPRDKNCIMYLTENPLGIGSFDELNKKSPEAFRYMMYCMNVIVNNGTDFTGFNNNECIVEHIIPVKNKKVWQTELNIDDEDKMSSFIHQFGNLVLVTKLSDSDYFRDKSVAYRNSEFVLTKQVGENRAYNERNVKKQTKLYAKLFCKAFPIPAKYLR